ncbi:MAG: hypothetical protein IT377_17135 [Polyangiaceae bacterium]|nr:hypothetical protein [Polyangiaceae bacterium]
MNKYMSMGAIACAVAMAVACGDDEDLGPGTGGAAGTGGSTGGGGGSGGGSAGSGGGSSGSGGTAGSGGSDAGPDGDASVPAGRLLVAGTDFATKTEIATVDLETNKVAGSVTVSDGDAVPVASNGQGFVLERTNAKMHHLDATGKIAKTIDVGKTAVGLTGTGTTNPVGVVTSGSKALVVLQDVNRIAVVDLTAGSVSKTIDLASYLPSGDGDKSVDAARPLVHGGRAYFLVGRIDRTTIGAPSYQLACPSVPALLLAVDLATDSLVDLNGAAAGEGLELGLANPVDAALDGDRMLILNAGCFAATDGGSARTKHGIEAVALKTGVVTSEYAAKNQDFLSRLVVRSSTAALVNTFDPSFAEHWYAWTIGQGGFGSELVGVPAAPSLDDANHLLGVDIAATDAGTTVTVVRYDLGAQTKSTVATSPWTGSFASAAGTALVR